MNDVLSLPKSWVQVTVADLGKVVSGGTPSTKENSYWGGNISWISPSDLTGYSDKHISKGAKSITQAGLKNSSATIMPAGSIHFSSRAPIGYTVISSCEMTTNQGFKSLVPAQGVFNEYIYYYFKSAKQLAESRATGTTFKEISGAAFSKLPVPLAPTNEQHRIVAKIEELFSELDKGIENLKTAQAQLKVYRQALLKHAFEGKLTAAWREQNRDKLETAAALQQRIQQERAQRYQQQLADWEAGGKQGSKPKAPKPLPPLTAEELAELAELPEGWGWARLCDLSDQITDGTHHTPTYLPDGVPFISVKDIRDSKVSFDDCKFISPDEHKTLCQRCKPEVDDLLITKSGTIGRMALAPNKEFSLFVSVALVKTQPVKDIVLPKWFLYAVEYHLLSLNIDQDIKGGLLKNYHLEDLRLAKIPLTCSEEQSVLVTKLEEHLSEVDQLELTLTTSLQQAESLRQSILKRAFSGQLVPQDPHDEPASALLARIQAEKLKQTSNAKNTRSKRNE